MQKIDSWLDPNGNIIEVGDCQHNEYASDLLEQEMGLFELHDYMDKENMSYPYEVLHKRGWVRIKYNTAYLPRIEILGGCCSLVKPMRKTIDPAMNERQLRVAKQLCEDCDTPFHVAINDFGRNNKLKISWE
jgi:hypothetical protein